MMDIAISRKDYDTIDRLIESGWDFTYLRAKDALESAVSELHPDMAIRLLEIDNLFDIPDLQIVNETLINPNPFPILAWLRDSGWKITSEEEGNNIVHNLINDIWDANVVNEMMLLLFSENPNGEIWWPNRLRHFSLENMIGGNLNPEIVDNVISLVLGQDIPHETYQIKQFLQYYPEYEQYYEPREFSEPL